jgi:AcrR family transcriptional regulator
MPSPPEPARSAITPERVTAVAADLTRRSHLLGWSMRDLTGELQVSPSVVYHHVGGKDMLSRRVVERALDGLSAPDDSLPWTEWFRALLADLYPRLAEYPGAAKWLLMHGPTFPTVMPVIGTGMGVLQRAGFGERAGMAYATLLNTPLLTLTTAWCTKTTDHATIAA